MLYLCLPLTVALYFLTKALYRFRKISFINPVLIPVLIIIPIICLTDLTYETYALGTYPLNAMLEPSIVALAIPLYVQSAKIKKDLVKVLLSCFISVVISIMTALISCHLLGVDEKLGISLASRSITTPLAISFAQSTGGIPAIAAAIVCIVGLAGAMIAFPLARLFGIKNKRAQGLAVGSCSHAIGTACAQDRGPEEGAYSSLALIVCGIITAVLGPFLIELFYFLVK